MKQYMHFKYTSLAAAIITAIGSSSVHAEMSETERLTTIRSSVTAGVIMQSDDTQRVNMYNGQEDDGSYLNLDIDWIQRDDETGTWTKLQGNNLGMGHRDIRFEKERQGDWGISLEYNQMPHHNPFDILTAMTGLGTGNQTVPPDTAAPHTLTEFELKTTRDKIKVSAEKFIGENMNVSVLLQQENKEGNRQWGDGGFTLIDFLAEPIDTQTNQIDVKLGLTEKQYQLEGGLYLTTFDNDILEVVKNPGTDDQTHTLPPSNESSQFYVTGGYNISPETRGNFKVSYTTAKQEEAFVRPADLNSRTNLGAKVNTTLVKLGLSTRPMPGLSLSANAYYEDRDDKTPVVQYYSGSSRADGNNVPFSRTSTKLTLDSSYRLPNMGRLSGGIKLDNREYSSPPLRTVSYRDETDETIIKLQYSQPLGERANGLIALINSSKDGSEYLENAPIGTGSNEIDPINWADRDRQQIQLMLDWMASEELGFQFMVNTSDDEYDGRELGPRDGSSTLISMDVSYAIDLDWQVVGWISTDETELEQLSSRGGTWSALIGTETTAIGLGFHGKPSSNIKMGVDLQYSKDDSTHEMAAVATSNTTATGDATDDLDAYYYKSLSLKVFVDYALEENADIRFVYGYNQIKTNDWSWSVDYVDGSGNPVTTVVQDPEDEGHAIGVSYRLKWF